MVNLFFIDLSPYTFSHEEDRFKNHLTGAPVLREHAHVHQRVLLADDVLARGVAKDSEGGVQRFRRRRFDLCRVGGDRGHQQIGEI